MSVSCLVQVVRAKGTDDVKFPDQDDILELSVTGDSSLFAWAKHFTSMSGIKPLWSKVFRLSPNSRAVVVQRSRFKASPTI